MGVRQGILYNHTGAPGIPAVVGQALPVKKAPGPNLATRFSAPQKLAGCGRLRMANSKWQLHCHNGDARLVGFQRSTQAETHPKYFRLHYGRLALAVTVTTRDRSVARNLKGSGSSLTSRPAAHLGWTLPRVDSESARSCQLELE